MNFTTRPELSGTFGMVASTHWLASAAGMAVLEHGGNAFDAAVAAGLRPAGRRAAPERPGRRGADPRLGRRRRAASRRRCGQGAAPAAATIERYSELGPGPRARAPGCSPPPCPARSARGCCCCATTARCRCATCCASRSGTPSTASRCCRGSPATIARRSPALPRRLADVGRAVARRRRAPRPGGCCATRRSPRPTRRLVARPRRAGADREAQIDAAPRRLVLGASSPRRSTSSSRRAGRWTLRAARTAGCSPATTWPAFGGDVRAAGPLDYRGCTVCKTGPWGQGPVLLQQLALLDGLRPRRRCGHLSAELRPHRASSARSSRSPTARPGTATRRRDVPLDDAAVGRVHRRAPGAGRRRRRRPSCGPGRPRAGAGLPRDSRRRGRVRRPAAGVGEPTVGRAARPAATPATSTSSTAAGNMVSATPSGGWLQSSPAIPGLGFCLGTRAQMFWLEQGLPNSLRAGQAAAHDADARRSALRDGEPRARVRHAGRRPAGPVVAAVPAVATCTAG